jgi:hypothetical protein
MSLLNQTLRGDSVGSRIAHVPKDSMMHCQRRKSLCSKAIRLLSTEADHPVSRGHSVTVTKIRSPSPLTRSPAASRSQADAFTER